MAYDPRFDSNVYGDNERMRKKRKTKGKFSLKVRKGSRIWNMVRKFKSKSSRDRAMRGLKSAGWRKVNGRKKRY